MRKKTMYLTGLLAVSAVFTTQAQSVMLSNFEDNTTDGWQSWGGNGMAVSAAPTVSLGSYSLLETVNNQYWGQLTLPNWANSQLTIANLNAGSQISVDLYFSSATWLVNHANVNLELQNGGGTLGNQTATINQTLNSLTFDTVMTVTFDLSSLNMPRDTSATGINMSLYVQPGYDWMWDTVNNPSGVPYSAQQVYIDNVQIISPVPEPSTMALAALGGAALLFLRRRTVR